MDANQFAGLAQNGGQSNGNMGGQAVDDRVAKGLPGAQLGVGMKLPDGEVISGLDSSKPNASVTITRPDGSSYSVSHDSAIQMTGQTGIGTRSTGPVSQGASSDPLAGVTDSPPKRGNSGWNSMKANTNSDGSPLTLDQINQAKADLRAGNATNMADPIPAGATPTDDVGSYVQNKSTPGGGYSQTVRQNADPADPRVMAGIQAKQDYYKNDPQGQAEYAKIMGAGKGRNFEESLYNKQTTLKEWLRRDAQGLPANSVQLYPYVVEGIMDSIKGMFGGKKGAEAPAAGSGVNADALNKAWVAAGSPMDSEEVAKFLQSAGVPAETVSKVFTDLKLPAPTGKIEPKLDPEKSAATSTAQPAAPVNIKDMLDQILKLTPADQQQVLAYLKK